MTNQRRPSSPTANQRAALTSMTPLFLITILQTRGRCCIRMTSTWSLSPAPSSTISTIKTKLRPPELIKDILKDKHNKSQVSQVLDMGQFQTRICVNLFFHLIYVSSCFSWNIVVVKNPSISIKSSQYYSKSCQMYKYLSSNKYIVWVFNFDYVGFSVSPKFRHKTDTFKVLIRVVLATHSPTFEALLHSTARGMISLI